MNEKIYNIFLGCGVLNDYPFPINDFDSLTQYEMLTKCISAIKKLYANDTTLTNRINALYDFVTNYFNNLDVQEEINNKLDEMVEDGTLQEIISEYLNSTAIFGFDSVEEMTSSSNLINGSYAQTTGYYEKNDGGAGLYKIRTITNSDVVNGGTIIAMNNESLVAELINESDFINVKQFGAKGDGETDDTSIFETVFNYANTTHRNIYVPVGSYVITQDLPSLYCGITIKGDSPLKYQEGSIILDERTTGNYLITLETESSDFFKVGGGIRDITFFYNGDGVAHCLNINKRSAGWMASYKNVRIIFYKGTAIRSIANTHRFNDCQITHCGGLNNGDIDYAIHLTEVSINNEFNGCHIEHCRYAIKIDGSGFSHSFNDTYLEMSTRGLNYQELSAPISITSSSILSAVSFINCSFTNVDINAYSNTNDSTFSYDDVPALIYSSSGNVIIDGCKFIGGLGSANTTFPYNQQTKYLDMRYGIITNNVFFNVSSYTSSIKLDKGIFNSNELVSVNISESYPCTKSSVESIINNVDNLSEIKNNYFRGVYADPMYYYNKGNQLYFNNSSKYAGSTIATPSRKYTTIVLKPTDPTFNLYAYIDVSINNMKDNVFRGNLVFESKYKSGTNTLQVIRNEMNIPATLHLDLFLADGCVYIQFYSGSVQNVFIDVNGIDGRNYTWYVDKSITELITTYDATLQI